MFCFFKGLAGGRLEFAGCIKGSAVPNGRSVGQSVALKGQEVFIPDQGVP